MPIIFVPFLTRIHFEYFMSGANVLAGVSLSTIGGVDSIMSCTLIFFETPTTHMSNNSRI